MRIDRVKILNADLVNMASLVEKQIYDSMVALKEQDSILADKIIENDDKVDDMHRDIEEKCVKFMATESPVAKDLRRIYTTSKIVTDLERMADHAVDICKNVKMLKGVSFVDEITPIWRMGDIIIEMIKLSIEAYVSGDVDAAYEISRMDDAVDEIHEGMFETVLKKMAKDDTTINQGMQILFISKYIERIGDHVTNICEWIIFSKKGTYVDLNE
ncbi:phosphate signaling complex protein PhoU [Clostridium gasigenes]|uniref:phosphate signaling complex protein PhoU n=1 Tax=Clostridium gasigenes TaxID=94869 RepID=UPI0014385DF9|nr:phosphate signaling complex protein PhoU [Clostridium gasigenes]NKF05978.1 phosphate signaling complex protein PhoU [Clostridium gasigenes]QSW19298.1 phosphate signaling complex protein PhoU [Clostridium gasigenes]